jgi:hypothetical protein
LRPISRKSRRTRRSEPSKAHRSSSRSTSNEGQERCTEVRAKARAFVTWPAQVWPITLTFAGGDERAFDAIEHLLDVINTQIRSIAGILRPTSGHIAIDGHDIVADAIAERGVDAKPEYPAAGARHAPAG